MLWWFLSVFSFVIAESLTGLDIRKSSQLVYA